MSNIGEKLIEGLKDFLKDLRSGKRIKATRLERCGCKGSHNCRRCSGTGFVRTKTYL